MVSSSRDNWILAIDALHGNPFDGHTLKGALRQVKTDYRLAAFACLL